MNKAYYILRHTAVAVDKGICYGQTDLGLSKSFPEELARIKEKLKGLVFKQSFSSPLKRCVHLASALQENFSLDPRLMEMDFGDWEGKKWDDIFAGKEGKLWFANYLKQACPGGESFKDLQKRTDEFLTSLEKTQNNNRENCLIVTHAGVIRAILAKTQKIKPENIFDIKVDFGEIIKIDQNGYKFL